MIVKKGLFVFFVLVFLFSCVYQVQAAVGISPGLYTVDFVPNLKAHFSFEFLGDANTELEIYASGDLSEYVKLSAKKIKGNGGVGVDISLPKTLDTPGSHDIYIGARQIVDGNSQGFGIIGNIKGIIRVVVPYPGQYVLFDVKATNANAGEMVNLSAFISNLGTEEVQASGNIKIYNDELIVNQLDLGTFDLKSPDQVFIVKYLDTSKYIPGNYLALGNLKYGDDKFVSSNMTFRLGELYLSIMNYTKILERNKINKFEINVESRWNDPIDGVYANVTLQEYPVTFLTPTISIDRFGNSILTGFFDTSLIPEEIESISALVRVHYGGKSTDELVTLSFKKKIDYVIIALVAGLIVLIALVAIVTYLLRRVEKGKKKK